MRVPEKASAHVHLGAVENPLLAPDRPFPGQWTGNWQAFLTQELTTEEIAWIRQNLATGRPTATREFVKKLEQETGKLMTPQPRGRKPAALASIIDSDGRHVRMNRNGNLAKINGDSGARPRKGSGAAFAGVWVDVARELVRFKVCWS